jgi:hypothetical protein
MSDLLAELEGEVEAIHKDMDDSLQRIERIINDASIDFDSKTETNEGESLRHYSPFHFLF